MKFLRAAAQVEHVCSAVVAFNQRRQRRQAIESSRCSAVAVERPRRPVQRAGQRRRGHHIVSVDRRYDFRPRPAFSSELAAPRRRHQPVRATAADGRWDHLQSLISSSVAAVHRAQPRCRRIPRGRSGASASRASRSNSDARRSHACETKAVDARLAVGTPLALECRAPAAEPCGLDDLAQSAMLSVAASSAATGAVGLRRPRLPGPTSVLSVRAAAPSSPLELRSSRPQHGEASTSSSMPSSVRSSGSRFSTPRVATSGASGSPSRRVLAGSEPSSRVVRLDASTLRRPILYSDFGLSSCEKVRLSWNLEPRRRAARPARGEGSFCSQLSMSSRSSSRATFPSSRQQRTRRSARAAWRCCTSWKRISATGSSRRSVRITELYCDVDGGHLAHLLRPPPAHRRDDRLLNVGVHLLLRAAVRRAIRDVLEIAVF